MSNEDKKVNKNETKKVDAPEKEVKVVGIVTGCDKLRVRKIASVESDELCLIDSATEVLINEKKSTKDFYCVTTPTSIEGYCHKNYITLK